jgi:hypothetical protein
VLEWVVENECPMNEEVCVAAVGRRKSSLLEASLPFPSTKRNSLDVLNRTSCYIKIIGVISGESKF